MDKFKKGDIVKSKSNDRLMSIKEFKVSKAKFNTAVLDYFLSDNPQDVDANVYTMVCHWEENGLIKTQEFKHDELVFVRRQM